MPEAETAQWAVPAPLRTLTWWPVVAFVLGAGYPESVVPVIALSGVVLVLAGALVAVVTNRPAATGPGQPVGTGSEPA